MTTNTHPVDSTRPTMGGGIPDTDLDRLIDATIPSADEPWTWGRDRRVIARWAEISVQAGIERHPEGYIEPLIMVQRNGRLGREDIFDGPLSPAEALELARTLIAAVHEAQDAVGGE